ncbi:MAG: 30S ribosomal protein S20 [Planctomycetes bacterium]|nr:30S ribosomal protein S20 [Planctomycetota bacterium]
MAHSLSAKKRMRQNVKRRGLNRATRSTLKTDLRDCMTALGGSDAKAAAETVRKTVRKLDREANKGVVHKNTAARRKSRLARRLNAQKAKSAQ